MRAYLYRAKKSPNEVKEGVIQADSEEEVISKVNDMGFVVVHIEEQVSAGQIAKTSISSDSSTKTVSYKGRAGVSVTRFYKQFSRIIQSGIPILQALTLMSEQTDHPRLKHIIQEIQKNVAEGQPLSQSLAFYAEYFSPFDLAMIEAGELVGHLDDSLKRVSAYRESQQRLMSKIRGALAYPVFVTLAGIVAIIFMLSFVMPKFSAFFLDLGQQLPLMTRILIGASQIAEKTWPIILGGAVFMYILFAQSLKADGNRLGWHRFYLGFPKVGQLIVYSQFARFSRTLSLLLESGIPLLKAMQTSFPVVTNQVIRAEIQSCHAAVVEGGSFAESLSRSHWVPPFVTQLIRAGEASGRLQESLNDIADWYEQELQENMEVATKLLEPILILVVGSILGVMVIAVLLPIFSMNAAVS